MTNKTIEIDVKVDSKDAVKGVDNLGDAVSDLGKQADGLSEKSSALGENLDSLGGGFGGAIEGAKGLGKQFLALIANPIVAVIAGIAVVLGTLFKAFSRTEEGSNKLNKGMNVLTGVFNALLKVLEPLASFIVDYVVKAFDDLATIAGLASDAVSSALEFLGFGEAAKALDNFTNSTDGLIKKTQELSDLQSKLLKSRREQSLIEKQALIDAEKLRQQRDDESNSLQERIEFNRQLSEVLQKQSKDELAIANDALRAAELKLEIDGKTTEALDGLAEAQLEILDIQERINGQQSEQLANENSLRNEGIAAAKERADIRKAESDELEKIALEEEEQRIAKQEAEQQALDASIDAEIASIQRGLELKRAIKLQIAEEGLEDPNLTPEQIIEKGEAVILAREEIRLAEQEIIQANFDNDLISQEEKDALLIQAEKKKTDTLIDLSKREAKAFKDVEAAKDVVRAQSINAAVNGLKSLTALDEENRALQAASLIVDNTVGIAKTIQSTTIANAKAVAASPLTAGQPFVAINTISGALGIAASIKATAKGLAGLKKGGSPSAGASLPTPSGGGTASAPTINDETLFSTQDLQGAESEEIGQGAGLNQIKAIVVESDITNAQDKISSIESASEIG